MEVALGIDNLIFIAVLTNKLPENQRVSARRIGISAALLLWIALLFTIATIVTLTMPFFSIFGLDFSWRDLILIAGGCSSFGRRPKRSIIGNDLSAPNIFDRKTAVLGFGSAIGHRFCFTCFLVR